MARYRKIDVKMWGDKKFRALSAPQPNAQTLWKYLLTSPKMTNIPGVIPFGEAALAEALRWPLIKFRQKFRELQRKKMVRADWKAQFVWIPNAIKYNPPESPNVVKSWLKVWGELPECKLKNQAFLTILHTLEQMGQGFIEAFKEGLPKGFARSAGKVYGESGTEAITGARAKAKKGSDWTSEPLFPSNGNGHECARFTDHVKSAFKGATGATLMLSRADENTIKAMIGNYDHAQLMALWDMFMEKDWDWKNRDGRITRKVPHDIKNFREKIPELLENPSWKERMLRYQPPDSPAIIDLAGRVGKSA